MGHSIPTPNSVESRSAGQNEIIMLPKSLESPPTYLCLSILILFWFLDAPIHVRAAPMPSLRGDLPPPYSHDPPAISSVPSSEASSGLRSPPPSYSEDMIFRVLNKQNFTRPWMSSVFEHDPAVRVTSEDMAYFARSLTSYKCKSPQTRGSRNSAICTAQNPNNKKTEVTMKVLQQLDRSALSEVKALAHFYYLFDSGLLKGKPIIVSRQFPEVPLQKTNAWVNHPDQRDSLKEQVRAKVRAQVILWAIGDKLFDLHWSNFLVEMTKDDKVKDVHIVNFEYPLLTVNLLSPYTTRGDLEAWFNVYWDYRIDLGHWEIDNLD
ncbi:hypothetical protein DFH05DRAFT_812114, partial [Lentinula detonsa]